MINVPVAEQPDQPTVDFLKSQGGLGHTAAEAYALATEYYPELAGVNVVLNSDLHGLARAAHQSDFEDGQPRIILNPLFFDSKQFQKIFERDSTVIDICADELGIEPVSVTPELAAKIIFLHELGHTHDFLHNWQDNDRRIAQYQAELASLPVPSWSIGPLIRALKPGGKLEEWYAENRDALARRGLGNNELELVQAQRRAYRQLPGEAYADNFAFSLIRKERMQRDEEMSRS